MALNKIVTFAIYFHHINFVSNSSSFKSFRRLINKTTQVQTPPTKLSKPNGNSFSIMKVANGKMLELLQRIQMEHLVQLQVQELQALLVLHLLRRLKVIISIINHHVQRGIKETKISVIQFLSKSQLLIFRLRLFYGLIIIYTKNKWHH